MQRGAVLEVHHDDQEGSYAEAFDQGSEDPEVDAEGKGEHAEARRSQATEASHVREALKLELVGG
jgi:hypothetical protein